MPVRKSKRRAAAEAEDLASRARELAEEGGEAVQEFASTTRQAAKEFATRAFEAAKDLLETVEQADDRLESATKQRRRGRKLLKATIAIGAGVALVANEKVRTAVTKAIGRGTDQPEAWTPPSATEQVGSER